MIIYPFEEQPGLGAEVLKVKPFCKLTKQMDIPIWQDIVGDFKDKDMPGLAGKKFSRLCGFTFKTNKKDAPTQTFQIVYVPKLKGPLTRNNHGLHGWYCWMVLPNGDRNVVSISDMKRQYGFDVNKFFHTDYFQEWYPVFQSNIRYALDNQIKELIDNSIESDEYNELIRYVNAIKDSVPKMDEVMQVVTYDTKHNDEDVPDYAKGSAPDVGDAKIAYNANKSYRLKDLDRRQRR